MKNKKIIVSALCICMLGAFGFIGVNMINGRTAKKGLTLNYIHANYSIDVENKEAVVGDADYVFVAKIVAKVKTEYRYPIIMETENGGTKEVSKPYTIYSIQVIDNIKGNLQKNKSFDIAKTGGISKKGDTVDIFNDDELPQENEYYIMMGYAQPNGTILVNGANSNIHLNVTDKQGLVKGVNSNIHLNVTDKQEIVSSKEYKEYKEAVKNEVMSKRKKFTSIFQE